MSNGGRGSESDEDQSERIDRELIELLNELRVALPGAQVLFAFLLTVAFSGRFRMLTDGQRAVYFATVLGTTIATGLFMAPTAYHRIRFRQGDKERLLRTSNAFAIVGIAFLALSITLAVLLITDLLFGWSVAVGVGVVVLGFLVWVWFAIPALAPSPGRERRRLIAMRLPAHDAGNHLCVRVVTRMIRRGGPDGREGRSQGRSVRRGQGEREGSRG